MSSGPFPDRVDAGKLFARSGRIDAALPLSRLTRLVSYLAGNEGQVRVALQFGVDQEGRKRLTGTVDARLTLVCQRCLQPLGQSLALEFDMLVFNDREELSKQLGLVAIDSLDRDVLVLDELAPAKDAHGEELDLVSLVEDELILGLPLVPSHQDVACSEALNRFRQHQESAEDSHDGGKASPFAVLAQLKRSGNGPASGK